MIRKAMALVALVSVCLGVAACNSQEKDSGKAPLNETQLPAQSVTPATASAGSPGELPPPDGFKRK